MLLVERPPIDAAEPAGHIFDGTEVEDEGAQFVRHMRCVRSPVSDGQMSRKTRETDDGDAGAADGIEGVVICRALYG